MPSISHISMKKLYGLAYQWAAHKEAHSDENLRKNVGTIIDFLVFVWKHKGGKASSDPSDSQEAV